MTCFLQQIRDMKTKEEELLYVEIYLRNILIKFNMWTFNYKKIFLNYQEKSNTGWELHDFEELKKFLLGIILILWLCSCHI